MGEITRLSISPSGPAGFCFTASTKRGEKKKEQKREIFTDGGIEPKSEKRDRSWEILQPAGDRVNHTTVEKG